MRKNKIQKISIVALTGLIAGASALAFLNTSEVQSGTNMIKPGQISIMFDNETDAIVLSQNTAIPMSDDYAKANLVSYKFDIVNDGDIDLDYAVYADNINSTFDTAKIDIMLKDGAGEMTYVGTLEQINKDAAGRIALVSKESVAPNDTHSYELIAHIDGSVSLNDYTGKTASFGLKVEAEQHVDQVSAEWYMYDGDLIGKTTYDMWVANSSPWLSEVTPYYGDVYQYDFNGNTRYVTLDTMYKTTLEDASEVLVNRQLSIGDSLGGKTVTNVEPVSGVKVQ